MFVVRTTQGLILGPFDTYAAAEDFGRASIFEIDDVYAVIPPRPDQRKGYSGRRPALNANRQ